MHYKDGDTTLMGTNILTLWIFCRFDMYIVECIKQFYTEAKQKVNLSIRIHSSISESACGH